MLWLPPIWLFLFLMLLGCGLLLAAGLQRLGGPRFRTPLSIFQAFWFGYAFAILFLQLYSLAWPVQAFSVVALSGAAAAGFYAARRQLAARLRRPWRRPRLRALLAIALLLAALLVAARAAGPVTWYDTELYHLQTVKWARAFPAVPGIANLHYRLAYNNSVHLFGALADVLWRGRTSHIALGLLVGVLWLQLGWCALRTHNARARAAAAFSWLVLPFVLGRIWSDELPSLSSDLALGVLCIVIALELIRLRWRRTRQDLALALPLALAAVATTTKLGGAGMLAVVAVLALQAVLADGWSARRLLALAAVPALVLLGYFARQAVLSGWLLFPAPLGNLQLAWSFPEAEALDQFRWIQSWARIKNLEPAAVLDHGFMRWFRPWLAEFARSAECVVLAATALAAGARLARPRWLRGDAGRHGRGTLAAALASLVLWFKGAPDLRFGAVFFWILLAAVSSPLLAAALKERSGMALALAVCAGLSAWTGRFAFALPDLFARSTSIPALPPRAPMRQVAVSPGLEVFVPEGPHGEDRCGDHPLPCTPYPVRQRLRREGDFGAGFVY